MQQRDFIKDEIERLGRVLGKLVTMVLGGEGGDMNPIVSRQMIEERLRNELGIDPNELLELSREELLAKLDELNLQPSHLDQLGDFLAAWAGTENDIEVKALLFRRALLLYDLAGERSGTYSMIRADKEKFIRENL